MPNGPANISESADTNLSAGDDPVAAARPLPPIRQRTRLSAPAPMNRIPTGPPQDDVDAKDYEVGYRKPPRHSRFKPGQSGNPRGRPGDAKGLKTIVRDTLTAKVLVRTATGDKRMSRMEAVMHKTVELGMKGNPRALAQLIALYGAAVPEAATAKVVQAFEELSATDIAIIQELKASWAAKGGDDE